MTDESPRYHFYLATGPDSYRTKELTDIDLAILLFRQAIVQGHEYGCLEFLRDVPGEEVSEGDRAVQIPTESG